jgi:hypothetical protein
MCREQDQGGGQRAQSQRALGARASRGRTIEEHERTLRRAWKLGWVYPNHIRCSLRTDRIGSNHPMRRAALPADPAGMAR